MNQYTRIIGVLVAIAILDGGLKYFAISSFPPENDPNLSPIFAFALHKNPGIAFDIPIPFIVIAPITVILVFILAYHAKTLFITQPFVALGNVAIILGALGNFFDRAINGFTTDYLMFFKTSVLNLADMLIFCGAITLLVYYKVHPHQRRA